MDIERPHRTTSTPTTTSELFICFTSRLSNSSSMRLSSKSILSPGRAASSADKSAASLSLPTSLSRRLRHNGSLKAGGGAQSPAMFSSKKSRGSGAGFDNPEPSSPKVTCIGQVRVKTKKQGKKMKMRACRSKRLSSGGGGGGGSSGEASFRRIEHSHHHEGGLAHQNSQGIQNQPQDCNLPHRNQRWVHLPLTICEALRTFGAEFSCLLPCKSSCFSSCNNNLGEKGNDSNNNNANSKNNSSNSGSNSASCGAVFRWLVALQEGEGKERDIELVVREDEGENRERIVMERECSRRRSIFDDMDFEDEIFDGKRKKNVLEDEDQAGEETDMAAARVSVCVPPKNALLLMRCRSDPVKMSALSHKIWDAPIVVNDYDDEVEVEEEEEKEVKREEKRGVKEEKGDLKEEGKLVVCEEREELEEGFEEIDEMCEDMGLIEENEDLGLNENENENENEDEDLGVNMFEEYVEVHEMGFEDLGVSSIEGEVQKAEETEEKEETGEKQSIKENGTEEKQSIIGEETEGKQSIIGEETEEKQSIIGEEESQSSMEGDDQLRNSPLTDVVLVEEKLENGEKELDLVEEERETGKSSQISSVSSSPSCSSEDDSTAESEENEEDESEEDEDVENGVVEGQVMAVKSINEDEEEEDQPLTIHQRSNPIEQPGKTEEERENNPKCEPGLPDCLLLMMCEPKLSMEVSKETWVCTTDFARWLPERHHPNNHNKKPTKTENPDESLQKKKTPPPPPHPAALKAAQPPIQPGRSSISFPASGGPVANLIEPKLVKAGGVGYEPFVLTRCKSAPMRSAAVAAKVAAAAAVPEMACSLWGRENSRRKMEPHRSAAAFGVGAAGVGF